MTTAAESLADRYSRLDASDLKAIVESPGGDYLPEAREAARRGLEATDTEHLRRVGFRPSQG